jgi:hypothetical protein
MIFLLQAVGVVAGGVFVVGFTKGFLEALADQHRRRKKLIEELGLTGPAPELRVIWPDDGPSTRRRRGAKR